MSFLSLRNSGFTLKPSSIHTELAVVNVVLLSTLARYSLRPLNASFKLSLLILSLAPMIEFICLRVSPLAPFDAITSISDRLRGEIVKFSLAPVIALTSANRGKALFIEALRMVVVVWSVGQTTGPVVSVSSELSQLVMENRAASIRSPIEWILDFFILCII